MTQVQFKVGDKIKRLNGTNSTTPIGFEGVIKSITKDPMEAAKYWFENGAWGYSYAEWTLVEQPTGPVVTETVTKTSIVPGTYSNVTVMGPTSAVQLQVYTNLHDPSPDELDAAAAVLSALAKGLRDA